MLSIPDSSQLTNVLCGLVRFPALPSTITIGDSSDSFYLKARCEATKIERMDERFVVNLRILR